MTSAIGCFAVTVAIAATPGIAHADQVWAGDFETQDLSQFNYLLNPQVNGEPMLTVVDEPVAQGGFAGRIELSNEARWSNGMKRVEFQHRPAAGRTVEGSKTFVAWSVYLPETLAADPPIEIGYWESDQSYQQMMAFQMVGETLRFFTRRPEDQMHWEAAVMTPDAWHRIALGVQWSTDPGQGTVDVWFDGQQVVTAANVQTLADGNAHVFQFGMLRPAVEFDDLPIMFVDDAAEGDSLEDVRFDQFPGASGGDDTGSGGADETGGTSSSADEGGDGGVADGTDGDTTGLAGEESGDTGGSSSGLETGAATLGAAPIDSDAGDSGCRVGSATASPLWLLALGLFGLPTRRRPYWRPGA